jgi:hypothetical protein
MAGKGSFDPEIREAMKPKSPRQDAKADGAGADQAATGSENPRPSPPGKPMPPTQAGNEQQALPAHLAAAAGIAHAILNSRPVRG